MAGFDFALLKGRTRNSAGWQDANLDKSTGDLVVKGEREHRAAEGQRFFYTQKANLGAGIRRTFLINTPASTKRTHLNFNIAASKEIQVEVWEGATASADGTAVSGVNFDRSQVFVVGGVATDISGTTRVFHTPTLTASGVQLVDLTCGFALGPQSTKEIVDPTIILASGTSYYIDIRAEGADTDVVTALDWFEWANEI
jgi:hypothetical protein